MFENAELGHTLDKQAYKAQAPEVRAGLLHAQHAFAAADFGVVVVVGGIAGGGRSEVVNLLLKWMDARGVQTHAMSDATDEEAQRPPMWRFWRRLPPRGRTAIFFGAWDVNPLLDVLYGRMPREELERRLARVADFERMLARENVLLVKFWLHLTRRDQKRRLKKLKADPAQRWRVTREDLKQLKHYDEFRGLSEHLLRRTGTAEAPWTIVEAADRRYRDLTVTRTLLDAITARLEQAKAAPPRPAPAVMHLQPPPVNVLNNLDMALKLDKAEYEEKLTALQGELGLLTRRLRRKRRSAIVVFEGADAAGKGSAIRRLTQAMDARDYHVISVAAPTDEERAHPYLWRFWRHLPAFGRVTVYDRSWYGRVLVERIEGFAAPDAWQRAYGEINDFEEQLTEFGVVVVKFWMAITADEQLRRFQDREVTPYKQYKLTEEDWRNRDRWGSYEAAACEMIERTSTGAAPWVPVEANDKNWARVKVLSEVVRRLRAAL
jgi:polyphosphate:AMP phosphotransferase